MSVRALRLLQELTPHFSSRTSAAFSPDAELLAEEFYNLHPDSLPDKQSSQRLREKTRQAALGLATALSKLADGPPLLSSCGAPADWPHAAHAQLRAASLVLTRCMRVGQRLGLTAKEGKRILYAAQLVLRASPLSLAAGRAAVAGGALPQQLELTSSLAAHCAAHASALDAVLQLYQAPKNKNALALFASDVARPDVLLPWARELAQALLALPVELFSGNEEAAQHAQHALQLFGGTLDSLQKEPAWTQHLAAAEQDAALQQALAALLVTRGLPALAAHAAKLPLSDAASLAGLELPISKLTKAVRSRWLAAAVTRHLQQEGACAPAAAAAAGVLQALPEQCPNDGAQRQFVRVWGIGVLLVMDMVKQADQPPPGQPENDSSSSGSSSAGAQQEWLQVTTLLLQLLPRLATALLSAVGDGGVPAADGKQGRYLAGWCGNLSIALSLCLDRSEEAAPADSLATWVQAAAAGLRLHPVLARLDPGFRQLQDSATHRAAEHLSRQSMRVVRPALIRLSRAAQAAETAALSAGGEAGSGRGAGSSAAAGSAAASSSGAGSSGVASGTGAGSSTAVDASLAADAALLHMQLCRLVHYLSSGGVVPAAVPWDYQVQAPDMACNAALRLGLPADGVQSPATIHARTLCATHWAALELAAGAAAPVGGGERSGVLQRAAEFVVASLLRMADTCPVMVAAGFLQPAHTALAPLAQDHAQLPALANSLLSLAAGAGASSGGGLACSFACSGLLHLAADCAGRLAAGGGEAEVEQVAALVDSCSLVVSHLVSASSQIANGTAGGVIPADLAEEAARSAEEMLAQQLALASIVSSSPMQMEWLQELVPAAERAAAVVKRHQGLPELAQARQLELARAAAGRGCAYLCCSNLQAGGGPAAGQGEGSMRCSACFTVWYCGTACSHADWRQGGHRRICKLLGEERRARKAAQQAAAGAADG